MMNNTTSIIEALLTFSKQAELLARLLSESNLQLPPTIDNPTICSTNQIINIEEYDAWPEASYYTDIEKQSRIAAASLQPLSGMQILEINHGHTHPVSIYHNADIDLITDDATKFIQPKNVRIINQNETKPKYDVGIIWESFESHPNPNHLLLIMKELCDKIIIKFRPWTSRDGGFQSSYFNRAYAQLLMNINTKVKTKITMPIAQCDKIIKDAGLTINERKVNSTPVEEWFNNHDILNSIIARTWGAIDKTTALRIMTTSSIYYVVSK